MAFFGSPVNKVNTVFIPKLTPETYQFQVYTPCLQMSCSLKKCGLDFKLTSLTEVVIIFFSSYENVNFTCAEHMKIV